MCGQVQPCCGLLHILGVRALLALPEPDPGLAWDWHGTPQLCQQGQQEPALGVPCPVRMAGTAVDAQLFKSNRRGKSRLQLLLQKFQKFLLRVAVMQIRV